jgi:hypothetical protein
MFIRSPLKWVFYALLSASNYLTFKPVFAPSKFFFESMKVPKNQQIHYKLFNKIFVKNSICTRSLCSYLELFLVLALNM